MIGLLGNICCTLGGVNRNRIIRGRSVLLHAIGRERQGANMLAPLLVRY